MFYEFWIYISENNNKIITEKIFQNNFLSFRFFIPKIFLAYRTTVPKTPKTVKGNFEIFKKCRGARRKV